jgi:hypothetical protein
MKYLFLLLLIASTYLVGTKIESPPFEWEAECPICRVDIKSGLNNITYTEDTDDGCYTVSGIGTTFGEAVQSGEDSPDCQEISHIVFYQDCSATAVNLVRISKEPSIIIPILVFLVILVIIYRECVKRLKS